MPGSRVRVPPFPPLHQALAEPVARTIATAGDLPDGSSHAFLGCCDQVADIGRRVVRGHVLRLAPEQELAILELHAGGPRVGSRTCVSGHAPERSGTRAGMASPAPSRSAPRGGPGMA
jgi:hypothetical protein